MITGANSHILQVSDSGNYQLMVTNEFGCIDTSSAVFFIPLGRDDVQYPFPITLFPIPAKDLLKLHSEEPLDHIRFTDVHGKMLDPVQIRYSANNQMEADISPLSKGVYFIKIKTAKGTQMRYFIKN